MFSSKKFMMAAGRPTPEPTPTIVGYVADSSFGAAEGTYCPVGTHAGSPYYAGLNSDGTSNGWLLFFEPDVFAWTLSQTDTPGVYVDGGYSTNGDPGTVNLTGWFGDTVMDLTLTTGTVCFETPDAEINSLISASNENLISISGEILTYI